MEFSADQLKELSETHEVFRLTDEEEKMLFSFRKFKAQKHKAGDVFTWQTHPDIAGGPFPKLILSPFN